MCTYKEHVYDEKCPKLYNAVITGVCGRVSEIKNATRPEIQRVININYHLIKKFEIFER